MSTLDLSQPAVRPRGDASPPRNARDDVKTGAAGKDTAVAVGDDRSQDFSTVLGTIDDAHTGGSSEAVGGRRKPRSDESGSGAMADGAGTLAPDPTASPVAGALPSPAPDAAGTDGALQSLMALTQGPADSRSATAVESQGIAGLASLIERAAAPPPSRGDGGVTMRDAPVVAVVAQATHFAPVLPTQIPQPTPAATSAAAGASPPAPAIITSAEAAGSSAGIDPAIVLPGQARLSAPPGKRGPGAPLAGAAVVAASPPASASAPTAGVASGSGPATDVSDLATSDLTPAAGAGAGDAPLSAGATQTGAASPNGAVSPPSAVSRTGTAEPILPTEHDAPPRGPGPVSGEPAGRVAGPGAALAPEAAVARTEPSGSTATAPSSTPVPATALPQGALQQIAEAVASEASAVQAAAASLPAGQAEGPLRLLTLQLHPAELGAVLVRMRLQDGQLAASLHASRDETAELLRKDGHVLTGLLRDAGYRPDSITVQAAGVSARAETPSNGGQAPGQGGGQRGGFPAMADGRGQGGAMPDQPGRRPPALSETRGNEAREQGHEATSAVRGGLYL